MARAKNMHRAAARRRHRDELRTNTLVNDGYLDDDDPEQDRAVAATSGTTPARTGLAGMFSRPDFRGDVRAFPSMFRTTKLLSVPFLLLAVGFAIDAAYEWSALPADTFNIAALAFTLILSPQALFVPFIGGFLAPRGAYLVGAAIGLLDAILVSALALGPVPTDGRTALIPQVTNAGDLIGIFVVAILFATFASAFASWYRRFLRQSQERARTNRLLRDQQTAAKRKEDERKSRLAERESRRTTARKTTP